MSDRPEWFAPKRYGYGAGTPIAWQGWAAIGLFIVLLAGSSILIAYSWIAYAATVVTLTAFSMIVAAKTTRGGWHWRSGEGD